MCHFSNEIVVYIINLLPVKKRIEDIFNAL